MDVSKASLYTSARRRGDLSSRDQSYVSKIFRLLRDMAVQSGRDDPSRANAAGLGELALSDVRARAIAAGWVEDQLHETLLEYSSLNVLHVVGQRIVFA